MKKIYITGIAGLLGCNIVNELKDRYEITGADLVQVSLPGVRYEVFDLRDYDKLEKSIKQEKPDVLIHTAAIVNVDICEVDKKLAQEVNAEMTKQMAQICAEQNVKMIYISSDAVFDGKSDKLYSESDEVHPLNEYAKSKYIGEQYTLQYSDNLVLRTNIYGLNIQKKMSFGEWIVDGLSKGEQLNMFEDIFFSPILVNDLANVIAKCIEAGLSGLYHVCATGAVSKYDFGVMVKEIFSIDGGKINRSTSDSMNFKAQRPKHMGMSNQKICHKLQIKIRTSEESIKEFHRLYLQRDHD